MKSKVDRMDMEPFLSEGTRRITEKPAYEGVKIIKLLIALFNTFVPLQQIAVLQCQKTGVLTDFYSEDYGWMLPPGPTSFCNIANSRRSVLEYLNILIQKDGKRLLQAKKDCVIEALIPNVKKDEGNAKNKGEHMSYAIACAETLHSLKIHQLD